MTVTATHLRKNIYKIFDQVIASGIPLRVTRKGKTLTLVPPKKTSKLANLKKRKCIKGDPEDLVHMDWSKEWKPFI